MKKIEPNEPTELNEPNWSNRTKSLGFQTLFEIRTIQQPNDNGNVRNPNVPISDVHCIYNQFRHEETS